MVAVYTGEGYTPADRAYSIGNAGERAREAHLLVALDDVGRVIGTVTLMTDRSPFSQIARAGEAEVRLLAVAPAARGVGAGEALMRRCLQRAGLAGCEQMVLSTQPTMLAAHRLYERLGFMRAPERDWERPGSGRRMLVYTRLLP